MARKPRAVRGNKLPNADAKFINTKANKASEGTDSLTSSGTQYPRKGLTGRYDDYDVDTEPARQKRLTGKEVSPSGPKPRNVGKKHIQMKSTDNRKK